MITIEEAYKIGNRMAKPWQWATIVLSATVAGLLYVILTTSVDATTSIQADELVAKHLSTMSEIKE